MVNQCPSEMRNLVCKAISSAAIAISTMSGEIQFDLLRPNFKFARKDLMDALDDLSKAESLLPPDEDN